ncbi:restriction endonuclease subunit S [Cerasibacillus sp. JNUCC 74]
MENFSRKLHEFCDLQNGYAFKSKDYISSSNTLICRMSNIRPDGSFDIEYKKKCVPDSYSDKYSDYLLKDGDLIVAMTDMANDSKILGVPTIVETKGYNVLLNQRVGKIIIEERNFVDKEYLKYALSVPSLRNYYKKFAGGGLQINIGKKDILNIEVPVPKIEVQKKIVQVLKKSQEIINYRKKQIEALEDLKQGIFVEMFSTKVGEKVILSDLCDINPPKKEVSQYDDDTLVSFIPMANVSEKGEIKLIENRQLKDVYKGFTYFKDGDVLFAKITPCMENGKGAIAKNLTNGIGFGSTEFHVFRPKKGITSEWLYYLTALPSFRIQAEKNMTGSAGQKRVPKQFFDKYKVVKPSLKSQECFKEIVSKIDMQKEKLKASLQTLEINYHSLMQRAFKGELFTDEKVSNL